MSFALRMTTKQSVRRTVAKELLLQMDHKQRCKRSKESVIDGEWDTRILWTTVHQRLLHEISVAPACPNYRRCRPSTDDTISVNCSKHAFYNQLLLAASKEFILATTVKMLSNLWARCTFGLSRNSFAAPRSLGHRLTYSQLHKSSKSES